MPSQLFTDYFLTDGIEETYEWRDSLRGFDDFRTRLTWIFDSFGQHHEPNEAVTEQELIRPVLELLGWEDYLLQQGAARSEDIPDMLLFADAESKARAAGRPNSADRYGDAIVVEESKRYGRALEGRQLRIGDSGRTPHGQLLRYLSTADDAAAGAGVRWGILTNGAAWRLYDNRARPRSTGYFEVDVAEALARTEDGRLKLFFLLFNRKSFTLRGGATATFIENAIEEGRRYEERVAQDLSRVVFDDVFPKLADALAQNAGHTLDEVRDAALVFLYRLLFAMYAEDRGLLPVNDARYDDYGLRKRVRDDVAQRMDRKDTLSGVATSYYDHLSTLFRLIDGGDPSIGLPPYNGGLFSANAAPLLESVRLSDAVIGPVVYALSHSRSEITPGGRPRFVNYRDMSVQQLGSIYERLLERELARRPDGGVVVRLNTYARKDTGSYFTPQPLVDLIVDRTLRPLVEERLRAFEKRAAELGDDRRPRTQRIQELQKLDPAAGALDLKVLDPAMGSGHFLVTAVDFLADCIADLIERVPAIPEWLEGKYASPVVDLLTITQNAILDQAREAEWALDEAHLTDKAVIRRIVLKRCIYGVDKNPLTVELAKVSLWLHSFTAGAPLSFLDHHLRPGDSLSGLRVQDAVDEVSGRGGPWLFSAIQGQESAASFMRFIEILPDANLSQVRESAEAFDRMERYAAPLRGAMDFLRGLRWNAAALRKRERAALEAPFQDLLDAPAGKVLETLANGPGDDDAPALGELWRNARAAAEREGFIQWEAAFPGVWNGWHSASLYGGFDAVIGNPPWDRIKLQEVEWFATRAPDLARAPTAAARKAGIRRLRDRGEPLAAEFDEAKARADTLASLVRESGDYPLLGSGDINLYSLFVERAMSLIKPDGFVGLLTPSGIYADKTAARFFKKVSTSGRLSSLFDFENRKIFFKEIHASFKFCALVFGGEEREFDETECAFFLHDTADIEDPDRCFPLAPADFARVNPEHRHRARVPHPARRRHNAPHLRTASRARRSLRRRGAAGVAGEVRAHVRHDQRFGPVQNGAATGRRRLLPGAGQPMEEGQRTLPAAVRREDGASVRSPRGQRGGKPGEPEPSRTAARGKPRGARQPELAAGSSILGL